MDSSPTYVLSIALPGKEISTLDFACGTYTIGRNPACDLVISDASVSELHAQLELTPQEAWLTDLNSSNGTFVDARPLAAGRRAPVTAENVVTIGGSYFRIQRQQPQFEPEPAPADDSSPFAQAQPSLNPPVATRDIPSTTQPIKFTPDPNPLDALRTTIKEQIHDELVRRLDLKRLASHTLSKEELGNRVRNALLEIMEELRSRNALPSSIDTDSLLEEIFNESVRLGPVEQFLEDDSVTEIMINGPKNVYVERHGKLELTNQTFTDDASVMSVIERIVAPLGRRIDESQPYVDARLPDGSRVNAIIPPLSLIGPCITIRKFAKRVLTSEDFISFGTWTSAIADFLRICVILRKNIIVAGGTGSGKTTLLNVLSSFIPHTDRILTIEDAAELRLNQPHVVRLEARPANIEGKGAVTIRDLVRNALRMRPDRIIVGECRGGESLDMLQAMNTGHDGSLTTVHANSPRDVVSRLETMVLMSGVDLPSRAIREQIASAVQIIVQESRLADGSRRIIAVSEITGMEGPQIVMQDLFVFRQTGVDAHGKILGRLEATGAMPTFFDVLNARGLSLSPTLFQPGGGAR